VATYLHRLSLRFVHQRDSVLSESLKTVLTQSVQKVHSYVQIRASGAVRRQVPVAAFTVRA
jgi:hypothetical protein